MSYAIDYTEEALRYLMKQDPLTSALILAYIEKTLMGATNLDAFGENLSKEYPDRWCFKVGTHRLLAVTVDDSLTIVAIDHDRTAMEGGDTMSEKCPFCQSEMLEHLKSENLVKEYSKKEVEGHLHKGSGSLDFPIERALCLECGMIIERMSQETLQEYREDRKYFKDTRWYYAKSE